VQVPTSGKKKKRNQSPTIKENQFREICPLSITKDGY
jgi:hypothetical protein